MAEMTPELRAALDTAKERIHVDSYYTKAVTQGLSGHAKGYIGGTMLGMLTGAVTGLACIGAMMLVCPLLLASLHVTIPALILGATALGAATGGTVGSRVGASAGAVSAAFAERERRDKADKLEQEVLASPDKQREVVEAYRANPVVEKGDTIGELYATNTRGAAHKKMFDLKTMLLAGLLCAGVGAVICSGLVMLHLGLGLGALATASVAEGAAIGAGIGAVSGMTFGVGYPAIMGTLTQKASDMLTGKMIRGKSDFGHVKTIAEMQQEAVQCRAPEKPATITIPLPVAADDVPAPTAAPRMVASELPSTLVSDAVAFDRVVIPQQQRRA